MIYVKIAVIGAQGHYCNIIEAIKHNNRISVDAVAPGTVDENIVPVAMGFAKVGVNVRLFDDYLTMLDEIQPDIVAVNSYFYINSQITTDLLRRKINVFCEKPLATDLNKLSNLYHEYLKSGVHLTAMHLMRDMPWFAAAHKAVRQGRIGDISVINIQKSYILGQRDAFFTSRFTYGGTIPWVGSHAVDLAYWFTGERFKSVTALHTKKHNNSHGDLENAALCQFVTEKGVLVSVSLDYMRPQTAPSHGDDRIRIAGTKGVVEVIDENAYIINDEAEGVQKLDNIDGGNMFESFMNEVKGFGRCPLTAEDAFYITRICLYARESADTGKTITF